jgi:hypothetical protein
MGIGLNDVAGGAVLVSDTSISGDYLRGRSKPDRLKLVLLEACARSAFCRKIRAEKKANIVAIYSAISLPSFLRELSTLHENCALCVLCVELCGFRP